MEFWEGAVLVVGGVWLVGRMSRASASSPLNMATATKAAVGTVGPKGNTVATNTDGSTTLVAGEPLTPAGPSIVIPTIRSRAPVTSLPIRTPVVPRSPISRGPVIGPMNRGRVLPL